MPRRAALGPIGIVGLGLVGGSLAKALRRARPGTRLIAVEPQAAARRLARRQGLVELVLPRPTAALAQCRLVVLAMPISALEPVLGALRPHLAEDVLLTDTLAVKAPVRAAVARHLPGVAFVGAHPMAGGEHGGLEHSRAELFDGKPVVVSGPPRLAREVAALWRAAGAEPVRLDADTHDRVVALTSHLPYLAALALVSLAARRPRRHVAGRGFFDATRRADFAPEVMAASVARNPHAATAARALAAELRRLAGLLESGPETFVRHAAQVRRQRRRLER